MTKTDNKISNLEKQVESLTQDRDELWEQLDTLRKSIVVMVEEELDNIDFADEQEVIDFVLAYEYSKP